MTYRHVYMNTNVTRCAVSSSSPLPYATEVCHISDMLQSEQSAETPLTRQLCKLTHQILCIAGVALVLSMR